MRRPTCYTAVLVLSWLVAYDHATSADVETDFFEKRIRPALVRYCYECHSAAADDLGGGLRLDSRQAARQGGDSGPAVVPGDLSTSLLLTAIRRDGLEMPPDKPLPPAVIKDFERWIETGAVDPRDQPPSAEEVAELSWQSKLAERRDWWSLQPVTHPEVAVPSIARSSDRPIDRFVLAKLEAAGLDLSPPADSLTLLRRLALVLTGLPPSVEQVRAVEHDPTAIDLIAADLLDSPHFGERWARHWMDVVRFAETHGYEWNHEVRDAWRYRDYLIRAFNADVPYDQLVREHIAGDLLPEPRVNAALQLNESLAATAFWRFGELGHDNCVRFPEIRYDALDNQIDTLTKAFQAATVSCARCHDHKLDAISTKDYYALIGIMESSRNVVRTLDTPDRIAAHTDRLGSLKQEIRQHLAKRWQAAAADVGSQVAAVMSGAGGDTELARQLGASVSREDPAYVLKALVAATTPETISQRWHQVAKEYRAEQATRAEFNAANFLEWSPCDVDWRTEGLGLTNESPPGDFTVALTGDVSVSRLLPRGAYTHSLTTRLNGTLQSPWLPSTHKYISIQYTGGGLSLLRAVVDSCGLNEFAGGPFLYLDDVPLRWVKIGTAEKGKHRKFIEFTTKSDNPRWPDRPGRGGTEDKEKLASPHSWFGVTRAVLHDCEQTPREQLTHIVPLFAEPTDAPVSQAQVGDAYEQRSQQAVLAWINDHATDDDVRWLNWLLDVKLLPLDPESDEQLAGLLAKYRKAEATLPTPRVIAGMADHGDGFDAPVLLRGNPSTPGDSQPRRYLEVLVGTEPATASGSGRLELAHAIASPDNPLTARVMVNRVWHHLFGTGLVRTTDDFGHMGEEPSHPELLDYLSTEFMRDGWSVKRLISRIVQSRTFRQSSVPSPVGTERDPDNRLLHHYRVRRLEAEAIRDSLLAVSGRLDRTLFGPSIQPFRAEPKDHRKLYAGPLDGDGRRSLYIKVTRMEGPRFLELFDLPDQMGTRGRRDRTSVPAQALAMLNDPFVIDQARHWGKELIDRGDESIADRVEYLLRKALGRPPSSDERQRMLAYVNRLAELHNVAAADVLVSHPIWQDVAHAVFNMKELIYVK